MSASNSFKFNSITCFLTLLKFQTLKAHDEESLEAPACDLTDVPDCYIAGLDMALVQVSIASDISHTT